MRHDGRNRIFHFDGQGHMNDHSKPKSVNSRRSRRSFIVEFGGERELEGEVVSHAQES
jgi:hypothetical protein